MLVRETAGALRGLGFDPGRSRRRLSTDRRTTSQFGADVVAVRVRARRAGSVSVCRVAGRRLEADPTPDLLVEALPDGATVCVIGWPDLVGEALLRRGDSMVLAVDTDEDGMGSNAFVRRLQRADVDAEIIPAAGLAAAVLASDLVVVEASRHDDRPAGHDRIPGARLGRLLRGGAGLGRRGTWPPLSGGAVRSDVPEAEDLREPWEAAAEGVPLGLSNWVVSPTGVVPRATHRWRPSAPCRTSCSAPAPCNSKVLSRPWPASVRRS